MEQEDHWLFPKIAFIFFCGSLAYFLYVFTPVVKAEDTIKYREVHTIHDVCRFARENPGAVTNLKKSDCV